MNRRRFFRQGLRELLRPLANAAAPLQRAAEQLGQFQQPTPPTAKPPTAPPPTIVPASGTVSRSSPNPPAA